MYFVQNSGELAGTLSHEVAHAIHHDTVTLMEKQHGIKDREIGASILLGPTRAHLLAILLLGKVHSLSYSRDVESRADITGSDVCAGIGQRTTNPQLRRLFHASDNAIEDRRNPQARTTDRLGSVTHL
jgi:predicted Zn-dependent protease